jgi:tetratricopeptide (TPR) repeat protein
MDFFGLGRSYYLLKDLVNADQAFSQIITLRPDAATGYLWSAKCKAKLDSDLLTGEAVPVYEKFIEVALPNADTYKKELGNAYVYLAYYQLEKTKDYNKAKEYAQQAFDIDAENPEAIEMLNSFGK